MARKRRGKEQTLEVSRQEIKFQLNPVQYVRLAHSLENVLLEDKHNGDFGYPVRSLYFDSFADTDFFQKMAGEENRKKIRLRTYDPDAKQVKLEIKRKFNNDQIKKSVWVEREDALALINCDYEVLREYESPSAQMLYEIMHVNRVRPVTLIEYNRKAFIHPTNNIRITLDTDIRASETCFDFFGHDPVLTPVEEFAFALAEVKFNGFLMGWLSELLSDYGFNRSAYSKYAVARSMLEQFLT
ncbi:polyphosphate polymerase domain-containing protein [Christensenellaceae bacterium OttesenSCG-928-K19]|nr:polyphosphate polymerase domain-containing protein [Christensenellaceae bacterium OttesenSCG-928-K19]